MARAGPFQLLALLKALLKSMGLLVHYKNSLYNIYLSAMNTIMDVMEAGWLIVTYG